MKHVSNNVNATVYGSVVQVDSIGTLHITAPHPHPHRVANVSTQDVAAGEILIQVGGKTFVPSSNAAPAEPDSTGGATTPDRCAEADDEADNDTDRHERCWGAHPGAFGIVDCDGREI